MEYQVITHTNFITTKNIISPGGSSTGSTRGNLATLWIAVGFKTVKQAFGVQQGYCTFIIICAAIMFYF